MFERMFYLCSLFIPPFSIGKIAKKKQSEGVAKKKQSEGVHFC